MALINCIECSGIVSDKALNCPHCGYPLSVNKTYTRIKKAAKRRNPNGYGTIVKLSGSRKRPYQVRVNTHIDNRGYPVFDVLNCYEDKGQANIALANYNKNPYDINLQTLTFKDVYALFYKRKFKKGFDDKGKRERTEYCYRAAYKHCSDLYNMIFTDIRTIHMQAVLDNEKLSHASLEHIKLLFNQIFKHAMEFDIIEKNYATFLTINKDDDDKHGVPFTTEDIALLWKHKDDPFVDTILIYMYSGWRINELARMPLSNINLQERTFLGGLKTTASKNRIVPIHTKIHSMVEKRYRSDLKSLIYHDENQDISEYTYRAYFKDALERCGIKTIHTPHDCRHTFNTLLDNAGVNKIARYQLMGHVGKDINEKLYTHKDLKQLRLAIEAI